MALREHLLELAQGNGLGRFWARFYRRQRVKNPLLRDLYTLLLLSGARRHGGYVGITARIDAPPALPHGLRGVYISRYAALGAGCRIYQNVTIGEVDGKAPTLEADCLVGAGAVLIGGIRVGRGAKIGAGAVVCRDVPAGATVVAQPCRILERKVEV